MPDLSPMRNPDTAPALVEPYTYFHTLFDMPGKPPVYVISSGLLFDSGVGLARRAAKGRPSHILVQPAWYLLPQAGQLAQSVELLRKQAPNLRFTFMAPTLPEVECLRFYGLDVLHIHKNAFIDERIFHPRYDTDKRYAAVHVANVEPFKRHRLAWGVGNLALVTYSYSFPINTQEIGGYSSLGYSNVDKGCIGGVRVLSPTEVADVIRASRCGLILSSVEGTNNASTEYLMCGIPVVTTSSKGGRSEFYDPRHVRIVQPLASAVEAAVADLNSKAIDPFEIHNSVMSKARGHRIKLIEWLCQVTGVELFPQANENFWLPQFTNKLRRTIKLSD